MSFKNFSFGLLGIAFGAFTMGALQVTFAWTAPTGAPPTPNVAAPINVGSTPQAKAGSIGATAFLDENPSYYIDANNTSVVNALYNYGSIVSSVINYSATNNWALATYNASWGANVQPQSAVGSLYVNDILVRSTGKWVSQISDEVSSNRVLPGTICGSVNTYGPGVGYPAIPCNGVLPFNGCPAGYYYAQTSGSPGDLNYYGCIKS